MTDAVEKIVMVAQDEGQLSADAVDVYWTSCTIFTSLTASILLVTKAVTIAECFAPRNKM